MTVAPLPPPPSVVPEPVRLWRCRTCGKWSHAIRRPKRHERLVESVSPGEKLIREDHTPGYESDETRLWVECGPFVAWEARQIEEN